MILCCEELKIPIISSHRFFTNGGDNNGWKKAKATVREMEIYSACTAVTRGLAWLHNTQIRMQKVCEANLNSKFFGLTSWALKYSSSPQCMSCSRGFTTWCSQSSLTQAISMFTFNTSPNSITRVLLCFLFCFLLNVSLHCLLARLLFTANLIN